MRFFIAVLRKERAVGEPNIKTVSSRLIARAIVNRHYNKIELTVFAACEILPISTSGGNFQLRRMLHFLIRTS